MIKALFQLIAILATFSAFWLVSLESRKVQKDPAPIKIFYKVKTENMVNHGVFRFDNTQKPDLVDKCFLSARFILRNKFPKPAIILLSKDSLSNYNIY